MLYKQPPLDDAEYSYESRKPVYRIGLTNLLSVPCLSSSAAMGSCLSTCVQRQTSVTAYLKSKQLLLFAFAGQCRGGQELPVDEESLANAPIRR